jgi:hypothetical protein
MSFTDKQNLTAKDNDGNDVELVATGVEQDSLKTYDEHSHLLREILAELKINNQYLEQVVGDENRVTESDIEIK